MNKEQVMLDIETMGNNSLSAIIAIGAVKFGNGEILSEFYHVVDLESSILAGLTMDASTVMWWMKQSDKARAQFNDTFKTPLEKVLSDFSKWISPDAEVWGNGSDFDNVILAGAYNKCGIKLPWKYYNNMCYRTIKNMNRNVPIQRTGTYHCAVDDAKTQAVHLMKILG